MQVALTSRSERQRAGKNGSMSVQLRVRRWVVWWIYVGVVCGAIALVNIIGQNLTRSQDRVLLILGGAHWVLGGVVCWAFEGVKFEPREQNASQAERRKEDPATEYHPASDFLLPGSSKIHLPWRH